MSRVSVVRIVSFLTLLQSLRISRTPRPPGVLRYRSLLYMVYTVSSFLTAFRTVGHHKSVLSGGYRLMSCVTDVSNG